MAALSGHLVIGRGTRFAAAALAARTRAAVVRALAVVATLAPLASATPLPAQAAPTPAAPGLSAPQAHVARELVVLVHGMGRTSFSMRPMAEALEEAGFEVLNHDYSSVCCPIPELGEQLRQAILARLTEEHTAVHFVGHSLGNILIRWVLTRDTLPPRVGRAVMLAPPNQGAAMADRFASVGGWLLKPIDGLRTDSLSVVRALPPVRGVGIVVVAAADDHTVQVEETRLPEALAHVVVEGGHTFIMRREEVQALTITFLRTGRVPETSAGRVDR